MSWQNANRIGIAALGVSAFVFVAFFPFLEWWEERRLLMPDAEGRIPPVYLLQGPALAGRPGRDGGAAPIAR
jgi:hypothetical protein